MKKHAGEVERHSKPLRLVHWSHVGTTTLMALTGFYLSNPSFRFSAHSVGAARLWHLLFAPLVAATATIHIYLALIEGGYRDMTITKSDLRTMGKMAQYEALLGKVAPPHGKYHVLQKMLYLSWIPAVALQTLTGLALAFPPRFALLIKVFHGLQVARFWHFLGAVYLAATSTEHFYRSLSEPDKLKSMVTGYELVRPPTGTAEELAGRPKKLR